MAKVITYDGTHLTCNGGTEADPITMANVLSADVAGGWGIVSKDGDADAYTVNAAAIPGEWRIGNSAASVFRSELEGVTILHHGGASNKVVLRLYSGSKLQLGLLDADGKAYDGSSWTWNTDQSPGSRVIVEAIGELRVYGSSWVAGGWAARFVTRPSNAIWIASALSTREFHSPTYLNQTFRDCIFLQGVSGPAVGHDIDGTIMVNSAWGLAIGSSGTARNVRVLRASTSTWNRYSTVAVVNAVDCEGVDFSSSHQQTDNDIYEQFTVQVSAQAGDGTPVEGATVALYDAADTLAFSEATGADGKTAIHDVTWRRYLYASGTVPTITESSPHRLRITWPDGVVTEYAGITVDRPLRWTVQRPDHADVAGVLDSETYAHGTLTGEFPRGAYTEIAGVVAPEYVLRPRPTYAGGPEGELILPVAVQVQAATPAVTVRAGGG